MRRRCKSGIANFQLLTNLCPKLRLSLDVNMRNRDQSVVRSAVPELRGKAPPEENVASGHNAAATRADY